SSLIAIALVVAAGLARPGGGRTLAMILGLSLVLLPLSGGSGLTMLPPLVVWLAGYVAWGWWSGRSPGPGTRALGLGLLLAGAAVVLLYLSGYTQPAYHPLLPSVGPLASCTLRFLSLAIYPQIATYAWPVGLIAFVVVVATLVLLTMACVRSPAERPRALGLMAITFAMICVAAAVALSRAAMGPERIMSSRYIVLATPMLCVLYVA